MCGDRRIRSSGPRGGADRLELCRALDRDGLTPPLALFSEVHDAVALPIVVMIRPYDRGYVYSEVQFSRMAAEAEEFADRGAAGIAIGALAADGSVDAPRLSDLVGRLDRAEVVFHRAFDEVPDFEEALEVLIACGVKRVLTSGGHPSAAEGNDIIRSLHRLAAGRIEVLPGAGIGPDNVGRLLRKTGCRQVHGTFRAPSGPSVGTDREVVVGVRRTLDQATQSKTGETFSGQVVPPC